MSEPDPPLPDVGLGRALRRVAAQAQKVLMRLRLGVQWRRSDSGFARRAYPSYEAYLAHQKLKFDAARGKFVRGHDERFYRALSDRLDELDVGLERRSVLCIAARQGTEVRAFIHRGAFAVGVDLNPGRENRYVTFGDFHSLQYADGSVDIAYTNSLDHAFDLDAVLGEINRVLAEDGLLIAEVGHGVADGGETGFYESAAWDSVDNLVQRISRCGFRLRERRGFEIPWSGEQLVMEKIAAAT